jgi:hypothetical protein
LYGLVIFHAESPLRAFLRPRRQHRGGARDRENDRGLHPFTSWGRYSSLSIESGVPDEGASEVLGKINPLIILVTIVVLVILGD